MQMGRKTTVGIRTQLEVQGRQFQALRQSFGRIFEEQGLTIIGQASQRPVFSPAAIMHGKQLHDALLRGARWRRLTRSTCSIWAMDCRLSTKRSSSASSKPSACATRTSVSSEH